MADIKQAIFYAYEYVDGALRLKKRGPFISWKFGKQYRDELTKEIRYDDEDKDIRFDDGIFSTQDEDQINYLKKYNSGGTFKLKKDGREVSVKADSQMNVTISTEDLLVRQVVKTETVTKNVSVLPKSALNLFGVQELKDFCIAESIDMPKEITKESLIDVLTQAGRIV